jgi:hypothetical protein
MRVAPIGQTPVAFALIAREAGIDLVEAPIRHLGSFDHAARLAAAIEHDPALATMDPVKVAQMVEVLNGLTARDALCLLVGCMLTVLD